ncbi:leucine-rich repeat protein [Tatlockia micdadei]|nr:leucine-rich repeat protein [Legionella micdadei]
MEQINIPENVRLIGRGAFWGCQNLRQGNIPKSVTTIGIEA